MLKISKKLSTTLSLTLSILFFVCCIAGLFLLPGLTKSLLELSAEGGVAVTQLSQTLSLVSAYCIVLDLILADVYLFVLLTHVRKGEVFTERAVSMIRGVSWCCMGLCIPLAYLGTHFLLSWVVCFVAMFLGLCLRVCKNAFEEATAIKQENDLTV